MQKLETPEDKEERQYKEKAIPNLDLDVGYPDDVVNVLNQAAEKYYESAGELSSSWQDKNAGKIWVFIAREFEKLATKIEMKNK